MAGDAAAGRGAYRADRIASGVRAISSGGRCRRRGGCGMNRALFMKAVGDSKILFAAMFALMFIFPCVFLWASGMISLPAFSDLLTNVLPKEWQRIWGVPI